MIIYFNGTLYHDAWHILLREMSAINADNQSNKIMISI